MARATAPTTILLVRHGTTPTTGKVLPGRAPGLHLSEQGRSEAEAVAARIASAGTVAALYASPLERTRETATPIAAATSRKVAIHRGLIECDFGAWTGAKLATLMKKPEWTTVQRAPSAFRFPGGESFTEMQARIVGALEEIRADRELDGCGVGRPTPLLRAACSSSLSASIRSPAGPSGDRGSGPSSSTFAATPAASR
jgi:probable phosphoglycerate mutase